jgi:hypothetical protein
MVGPCGLEPQTSTVSRWRSSQLSYGPTDYVRGILACAGRCEQNVLHAPRLKRAESKTAGTENVPAVIQGRCCSLPYSRPATPKLCTPEKKYIAVPLVCGSHHIFRTNVLWLRCMRRAAKSMSTGAT